MFGNNYLKNHWNENKLFYILIILIYIIGFIVGGFYCNFISQPDFESSILGVREYIKNISTQTDTLNFAMLIYPDLINLGFIILSAFFLPGIPIILFIIFKSSYSLGFFVSFLIKSFFMKGFFLGLYLLLFNMFFFIPIIAFISINSIEINKYVINLITKKYTQHRCYKSLLIKYIVIVIICLFYLAIGAYIKSLLLPKITNYLFP